MIRINLLPAERQKKERTPLPRFIAMCAALIVLLLLGFWDFRQFRDHKQFKLDVDSTNARLLTLKKSTDEYQSMLDKEKEITSWNNDAEKIKKSRSFLWWQQVDDIWDVLTDIRSVWISTFDASDGPPPSFQGKDRNLVTASVAMNCMSSGASPNQMIALRIALKNHPRLKEVFNFGLNEPPQFTLIAMPQTKEEWAVRFIIELSHGETKEAKK